jgi:histidine triad (HIT) family protein
MFMADQDCIFCKIVAGEIPAATVYENDEFIAFLDIAPVNRGHALVVSKGHYPTIWDVPQDIGPALIEATSTVGKAVMEATGAGGMNVNMNNHKVSGQLVPHAHWHLIPRFKDDGLSLWPQHAYDNDDEMNEMAASIREKIK